MRINVACERHQVKTLHHPSIQSKLPQCAMLPTHVPIELISHEGGEPHSWPLQVIFLANCPAFYGREMWSNLEFTEIFIPLVLADFQNFRGVKRERI